MAQRTLTREQIYPQGTQDFQASSSGQQVTFRIDPDPGKTVRLSSIELVTHLDTNATIALGTNAGSNLTTPPGPAAFYAAMVASEWSFHYPGGITSFIGRVRIASAAGVVYEEIDGVNVLAQTRPLFLGEEEAQKLNRMEARNIETNVNAFVPIADVSATTTGTGCSANGNNVDVSQSVEARFRFSSLGGFMDQDVWPLAAGLEITIYFAAATSGQRALSGAYAAGGRLQAHALGATVSGNNTVTFTKPYATINDFTGTQNVINERKIMVSGVATLNPAGYTECGVYSLAPAIADAATGIVAAQIAFAQDAAPPTAAEEFPATMPTGAGAVTVTPVDFQTKQAFPAANNTAYALGANPQRNAAYNDFIAHSAQITVPIAAGNPLTTIANSYHDPPTVAGQSLVGYDYGLSPFTAFGIYAGRMVKYGCATAAQGGAGQSFSMRFTSGRASVIAFGGDQYTVTLAPVTAAGMTSVASGADNLPSAGLSLLLEPDVTVTGQPWFRQTRLEYETRMGAKPNPEAVLECDGWRTEIIAGLATTNPSVHLTSTATSCDGVMLAIPDGAYGLVGDNLTSMYATYDNVGITQLPVALRTSNTSKATPSEALWLLEQAAGMRVKRPMLSVAGGGGFDAYTTTSESDLTLTGGLVTSLRHQSSSYCLGVPVDGRDIVRGRLRFDFTGTLNAGRIMYAFIRHKKTVHIKGSQVVVDY